MDVSLENGQSGQTQPRRRRWRWLLLGLLVLALGAAIASAALLRAGGTLTGPSGASFRVEYPDSWRSLSRDEFEALPAGLLAVLRREDGKGFVVITREQRAGRDMATFAAELRRELEKRIPDFQQVSAKIVTVRAGRAFYYSYIRRRRGTVHAIVIVQAGAQSYVLNTVSQAGAQDVARELGLIIRSISLSGAGGSTSP